MAGSRVSFQNEIREKSEYNAKAEYVKVTKDGKGGAKVEVVYCRSFDGAKMRLRGNLDSGITRLLPDYEEEFYVNSIEFRYGGAFGGPSVRLPIRTGNGNYYTYRIYDFIFDRVTEDYLYNAKLTQDDVDRMARETDVTAKYVTVLRTEVGADVGVVYCINGGIERKGYRKIR